MLADKLLRASAGNVATGLDVADVFSTDLYTGNNSTQSITNGVDLSANGGLVWIKGRSGATNHQLFDTERGATKELISNSTAAEATDADTLTAYNSDGFSIGADATVNTNAATYVGWTFRKAPKFFDVVKYTGDGVAGRTVSHNLGSVPGMIIVKRIDATAHWAVYHRSNTANPETDYLFLSYTGGTTDDVTLWNDTAPTDNVFTVGTSTYVNANTGTYVAYIFAHDASDTGVIQCGKYTGNGLVAGPVVTLGWQPQFLLVKSTVSLQNWLIVDEARGLSGTDKRLFPNATNAEGAYEQFDTSSTGFSVATTGSINNSGEDYIYMAIRAEGA